MQRGLFRYKDRLLEKTGDRLLPTFASANVDEMLREVLDSPAAGKMFLDVYLKGDTYLEVIRDPLEPDLEPTVMYLPLAEAGCGIFNWRTEASLASENIARRGHVRTEGSVGGVVSP